jgi:protein-S-isoprenylcysteine O-methyltransferase Ste14
MGLPVHGVIGFAFVRLVAERKKAGKAAKPLDKVLVGLLGTLPSLSMVVAGLDKRWGWFTPFPDLLSLIGFFTAILGGSLTYRAMKANPFFSSYVHIQKERGHRIVNQCPYGIIRHPGYAGSILFNLGGTVLLGSLAALGAGILATLLLILRTFLEDKTLRKELKGYEGYARRVRYRLVPGIW